MRGMVIFEFEPIFFLGWIIQPTVDGFEVYERVDTCKPNSRHFNTSGEAITYIRANTKFEER